MNPLRENSPWRYEDGPAGDGTFVNGLTGEIHQIERITNHYAVSCYLSSPPNMRLSIAESALAKNSSIKETAQTMVVIANGKNTTLQDLLAANHADMFAGAGVNGILAHHLAAVEREISGQFGEGYKYTQDFRRMRQLMDAVASGRVVLVAKT